MIIRIILAFSILPFFCCFAQKVAVVDVQKVFDGYQKVKDARERLDKSKKIANEELEIFKDELGKIVKELKEMEEKLKNPNLESSALKSQYQEKVKKAKEKQDDMIAYDKRVKATIAQRQRNLCRLFSALTLQVSGNHQGLQYQHHPNADHQAHLRSSDK